jgi:hypothetical protein
LPELNSALQVEQFRNHPRQHATADSPTKRPLLRPAVGNGRICNLIGEPASRTIRRIKCDLFNDVQRDIVRAGGVPLRCDAPVQALLMLNDRGGRRYRRRAARKHNTGRSIEKPNEALFHSWTIAQPVNADDVLCVDGERHVFAIWQHTDPLGASMRPADEYVLASGMREGTGTAILARTSNAIQNVSERDFYRRGN